MVKESIETKVNEENLQNNIEDETQVDQQRLDGLFMNWMNILKESKNEITPVRRFSYYVHALTSDYLKLLMAVYHNLKVKNYWTRQDIETIRKIQQRIKEENYSLFKTAWESKVEKLNRICSRRGVNEGCRSRGSHGA